LWSGKLFISLLGRRNTIRKTLYFTTFSGEYVCMYKILHLSSYDLALVGRTKSTSESDERENAAKVNK
jgi:hypothetical protein